VALSFAHAIEVTRAALSRVSSPVARSFTCSVYWRKPVKSTV